MPTLLSAAFFSTRPFQLAARLLHDFSHDDNALRGFSIAPLCVYVA
jgi:hypothetical protein